jgi:acetyl esterase/lipase
VVRPALGWFPSSGSAARLLDLVDLSARLIPRVAETDAEKVAGDGWHAELVTPSGRTPDPERGAVVYFHGGAFLTCGLATHRRITGRLAQQTGLPVLSVAYRQGRHGNLAVSVNDSVEAVNWMISQGYEPSTLVLAGDSAGGYLSFAVALAALREGLEVAGIVAISPWLDFDNTERRRHRNALRDDFIPTYRLQRVAHQVVGTSDLAPELSPVNADVRGLPPVLLMCGANEILRYDAELMTQRLEKAGVPVTLHVWEGQVHAFPVLADGLPEARAALRRIAAFVTDSIAAAAPERRSTGIAS